MALDINASDQEKGEAIKQWWLENARAVLAGIIMGLLILFGVRGWMGYQQSRIQEASSLYQQILAAKESDTEISTVAERLIEDYGNTPYGAFGALMLAKVEQKQGKFSSAIEHLKHSLKSVENPALQGLINVRLIRLLLAQGNPQEALKRLELAGAGGFSSAYAELRGDALVASGQLVEAQLSYGVALIDIELSGQHRQILQMKLDNIAQPKSQTQPQSHS